MPRKSNDSKQVRNPRPLMIAVGGMSGSGKTTLGHALSHALPDAVFLDSDIMKKKMFGLDPLTPLPDEFYVPGQIQKFIKFIREEAAKNLKNNDVVIVTGLFIDDISRHEQAAFAKKQRSDFVGLYLQAPLSTIFNRFQDRGATPSDATLSVLKRQARDLLAKNKKDEKWVVIDADQPFTAMLNDTLKALEKGRAQAKYAYKKEQPIRKSP